jgi:phosphoglycolate phosphatase
LLSACVGLQLAILSSDTTARVEQFVKENDLLNYVKIAQAASGLSKPDSPIIARNLSSFGNRRGQNPDDRRY